MLHVYFHAASSKSWLFLRRSPTGLGPCELHPTKVAILDTVEEIVKSDKIPKNLLLEIVWHIDRFYVAGLRVSLSLI